jgi:hypothetical protein
MHAAARGMFVHAVGVVGVGFRAQAARGCAKKLGVSAVGGNTHQQPSS